LSLKVLLNVDEEVRTNIKLNGQEIYLLEKGLTCLVSHNRHDKRIWDLLDKMIDAEDRVNKQFKKMGQAALKLVPAPGGEG